MRRIAPQWFCASPMRTRERTSWCRNPRSTTRCWSSSRNVPMGVCSRRVARIQVGAGKDDTAVRFTSLAWWGARARLSRRAALPEAHPRRWGIYRREIDRNPADPGLYDTLAAFLEQNDMGAEIEAVYQRAIAQFQDHSWQHKLARWYLREKRQADVAKLTRDVVKIFSGTELDEYFREIVTPAKPVGPALYLQLNLYAHQRFPHYLAFARNLLAAYSTAPTSDNAAYEALCAATGMTPEDLRMRFFGTPIKNQAGWIRAPDRAHVKPISHSRQMGRRDESVSCRRAIARRGRKPWRGHFENAAPLFLAIESKLARGSPDRRANCGAVYRSLGTIDPKLTDSAISVEEKLGQADPRNHQTLTAIGEIEAERERFDKARAAWDRIPEIQPAKPDGYLEAATVFWDYYRWLTRCAGSQKAGNV